MAPGSMAVSDGVVSTPVEDADLERWLNEGGHDAQSEARRVRVRAARVENCPSPAQSGSARPTVVVAGAGVAALETLLALHALAPGRLDTVLVAPDRTFVNRSMSVAQPFAPRRTRGMSIQAVVDDADARWHRGVVDRAEPARRRVVTRDGVALAYDFLVIATGAHLRSDRNDGCVLTYRDGRDAPRFRMLLHELDSGSARSVAFVKPPGPSWPLPVYDLALMTGAASRSRSRRPRLVVVTPEDEPLAAFGRPVAAAVRRLLEDRGIDFVSATSTTVERGGLRLTPDDRHLAVDRVVTVPRLAGPLLRGIPCRPGGFIDVDGHGRVAGLDRVFAAGDATTFPIKQGGLAAQQADAVAEAIAAAADVRVAPQPFRPVLRAALLTGREVHYLRADISGCAGDSSVASTEPLWWPPTRLCARYLAPYLAAQTGRSLDVMPERDCPQLAAPVHAPVERYCPSELADLRRFELADLPSL